MRDLGAQLRRVRVFLGLSQEEVARLAGVSQGAVSRLEAGRGLATPMLLVIKVHSVLVEALCAFDPGLVDRDLRETLRLGGPLPDGNGNGAAASITRDPGLDELVQLYRSLPERERRTLIAIMRATATSLSRALACATELKA
jgi:transcriptional regulator with XRE-family HTH domain